MRTSPRVSSSARLVPALVLTFVLAGAARAGRPAASELPAAWLELRGATLARHVAELASDAYEGREPGTPGEARTLDYIESAFRAAGLEPAGAPGSFRQPVPLVEVRRAGAPRVRVTGGRGKTPLEFQKDFVVLAGRPGEQFRLDDCPVVFAGHGITAEEYGWDDYAGVPVTGGVVLLLRGEPTSSEDSTLFRGPALTTRALSATKYETAALRGARGAIVIHTVASAGYPWGVLTGGGLGSAQNFLGGGATAPELELVIHVNEPAARRLLAAAGLDLDALTREAGERGFRARPTPLRVSAEFTATRRDIVSSNVIGRLPGREAPEEAVLYTAHWDHVGVNPNLEGDQIFNGAVDNATGTAALIELAHAFRSLPEPPRRSVYFVATTAEEKGLLGSEYLARNPVVPLSRTVAVLNLDALFPFDSFRAMTVTAIGSSELEPLLAEAAARLDRVLQDDNAPQAGAYYRSDHYPFAKRGVPALFAVGGPPHASLTDENPIAQRFADYLSNGYHKPNDAYDPATWDMRGIEEDARIYFEVGWRLAQDRRFPNWNYGNEFRVLRDRMRGE